MLTTSPLRTADAAAVPDARPSKNNRQIEALSFAVRIFERIVVDDVEPAASLRRVPFHGFSAA